MVMHDTYMTKRGKNSQSYGTKRIEGKLMIQCLRGYRSRKYFITIDGIGYFLHSYDE